MQAGRFEIAAALPGVEFPRLVPEKVTHISSQLVFDPLTGTLDVGTSAAFGLWTAEPYTVPRIEGQLVVLRVGLRSALPDEGSGTSPPSRRPTGGSWPGRRATTCTSCSAAGGSARSPASPWPTP